MTRQYGSFFNKIMDRGSGHEPEVGMAATILYWSDRHAATVIEVKRFKTGQRAGQVSEVTVQEDTAIRTDALGMSDSQQYRYEPNPNGGIRVFKVRKDGSFPGLLVGVRDHYYDYSF